MKLLKMWRAFWNDLKVFMNMDMKVFDDPATIIGGSVRPATARMVGEAHARAGVTMKREE